MATVHRHSFTRLTAGTQSNEHFCLNIVFVHGLRGHPRGTWETAVAASTSNSSGDVTKKSKGLTSLFKRQTELKSALDPSSSLAPSSLPPSTVFWPEEYLASDIPQAQVWTYGYNADVIGGLFQSNNKNSVSQHGRDLSVRLEREIDNGKPLAFVVHSLGGIILKDAIRRSEIIRDRTKLVVFLGTPHRGSAYAGWGQIASNFARIALQDSNKRLLETLEVNNEVLDNIHEEFKTILFKGTLKIHSFQESRGITGMKGLDEKVVDDFSSKLDLPRELETVESIDANHMQMARFSSRDDQGYRAISGVLKAFVRRELKSVAAVDMVDNKSKNALFMVPFARDDLFVGRADIITKISERRAAAPTHTRVALVGLGGVGKSQIAIEYAYRMQAADPHMLVAWIHASNPTRFQQGYREIADKLLLPGREDPSADVLQLVYTWLSDRRNGQWLMILDNVDDDSIFFGGGHDGTSTSSVRAVEVADHGRPLESFLPQTAHGTILITSRNNIAATNLVSVYGSIVQVEPMGEEEALALLRTRVPLDESSLADAKSLVHALELIPLAIAHATAYIKTRASTMTISTYLELFRESEANQVHLLSKEEWKDIRRDHSSRYAVIATWQISFKQIQKTNPAAADLLALISMFDKQGIPRWLLQGTTSQLSFNDALAPLLNYSLVRTEIGEQAVEMHRLVQLSMRRWLEAEQELSKWVKESIHLLAAAFPRGDYETWERCKVLLPHLREIIRHATEEMEGLKLQAQSALRAGWYLLLRGEYKASEGFLRLSIEIREKVLGPEHPDTLSSISQLGLVLSRQGRYEEAESTYRRALKGEEKVLGPEHPDTLATVSWLGSVLLKQRKYDEAEAIQRRALEGREKVLGREDQKTLISANRLGNILTKQGKFEEAKSLHQRTLEGKERVLGPEHPETLSSAFNLALLLTKQQQYPAAVALYQRAYEGYVKVLGAEHPYTVKCLNYCEFAKKRVEA